MTWVVQLKSFGPTLRIGPERPPCQPGVDLALNPCGLISRARPILAPSWIKT